MPINATTGLHYNYSVPLGTSNVTQVFQTVGNNLPWYWFFMILTLYIALYILMLKYHNRKKFVAITFIPMIFSWLLIGAGMVSSLLGDITTSVFVITVLAVVLTGG